MTTRACIIGDVALEPPSSELQPRSLCHQNHSYGPRLPELLLLKLQSQSLHLQSCSLSGSAMRASIFSLCHALSSEPPVSESLDCLWSLPQNVSHQNLHHQSHSFCPCVSFHLASVTDPTTVGDFPPFGVVLSRTQTDRQTEAE